MTKIKSYAKINLLLRVGNIRPDGYHELFTIFQSVNLYDEITFTIPEDNEIRIKCNIKELENPENLVYKAAELLKDFKREPKGINIYLEKKIPHGSGLGGGSSNAASTIIALNEIWDCELSCDRLFEIALKLGSDVPFFLNPKSAYATGRGEILKNIDIEPFYTVIIVPKIKINTAFAYCKLDKFRHRNFNDVFSFREIPKQVRDDAGECHAELLPLLKFISNDAVSARGWISASNLKGTTKSYDFNINVSSLSYQELTKLLYNDFECPIFNIYPEILEIKKELLNNNADGALLSGSGSAVFGVFEKRKTAETALEKLKTKYENIYIADTLH